jgi:hypothetical protein
MKKNILGFILVFSFNAILADDVVEVNSIDVNAIGSSTLGILPIAIGDSIRVGQFGNSKLAEKKTKLKGLLWKYITKNIADYSQFSSSLPCTTVRCTLSRVAMERRGSEKSFPAIKSIEKVSFNYLLVIELPFVYDDSSSLEYNPDFRMGSLNPVKRKPEEECINYGCKFIFYDYDKKRTDYYGTVTAEGCGMRNERFSDFGCWSESVRDLLQQIFEDTKFKRQYKKASDFR